MLLIDLGLDLMRDEHEVGPGRHDVRQQVLVLPLQLQRVLVDVLGILLSYFLRVIPRIFHLQSKKQISIYFSNAVVIYYNMCYLFNLFHTFEFDEQHDGIDLILMEALY